MEQAIGRATRINQYIPILQAIIGLREPPDYAIIGQFSANARLGQYKFSADRGGRPFVHNIAVAGLYLSKWERGNRRDLLTPSRTRVYILRVWKRLLQRGRGNADRVLRAACGAVYSAVGVPPHPRPAPRISSSPPLPSDCESN